MNNIFALATPNGKAGVAIIRVSGPNAYEAIEAFGCRIPKPRYASLQYIYDTVNKQLIDQAIILLFSAPNSFTGENVVEFHTHGSRAVINSMLTILNKLAEFRLAEAGEFALRSFRNNKMDLTQIEGLADLIDAETASQQRQAIKQMSGELESLYNNWRAAIIEILSLIEAYVDFPDEDLPTNIINQLNSSIEQLILEIGNHLADNRRGEKLRDGLSFTIIGEPNAGKSSLLNLLAHKEVAIVSELAGTTRDLIEVRLDLDGFLVNITDTAGIRSSSDPIEQEGIKRAINSANNADFIILIIDATKPIEKFIKEELINEKTIIVINKIDLIDQLDTFDDQIMNLKPSFISIKNNLGIAEFLTRLTNLVKAEINPSSNAPITRIRHRKHLQNVLNALQLFSLEKEIELSAEDLRVAATSLGYITGKIDLEEILDSIFGKFCIGK